MNTNLESSRETKLKKIASEICERLIDAGLFRNCLNCSHWQEGTQQQPEGCKLFRALPPPSVIVKGCESHSDAVPF